MWFTPGPGQHREREAPPLSPRNQVSVMEVSPGPDGADPILHTVPAALLIQPQQPHEVHGSIPIPQPGANTERSSDRLKVIKLVSGRMGLARTRASSLPTPRLRTGVPLSGKANSHRRAQVHWKSCLTKGAPSRKTPSGARGLTFRPSLPIQPKASPAHCFPPWEPSGQVSPEDCRAEVPHCVLTPAPQLAVHRAVESRPTTRT